MSEHEKAIEFLDAHYKIVEEEGLDRDGYHIAWGLVKQRISELEKEVEQAFEKGVKAVLRIRCMQHRDIQQINNTEITGGECGACVQEQAELRGEKRGFEAARERDSGYSYHDPDSPYPSSDPEMRGVRFVEGSYVYKDFDDYKQQKG